MLNISGYLLFLNVNVEYFGLFIVFKCKCWVFREIHIVFWIWGKVKLSISWAPATSSRLALQGGWSRPRGTSREAADQDLAWPPRRWSCRRWRSSSASFGPWPLPGCPRRWWSPCPHRSPRRLLLLLLLPILSTRLVSLRTPCYQYSVIIISSMFTSASSRPPPRRRTCWRIVQSFWML